MLVGGSDNINNDGITPGTCFSMFVYIRARFRFALSGRNMTAQSTGSHRGWRWNSNSRGLRSCKLSFLFPPRCQSASQSLLAGYIIINVQTHRFKPRAH